MRKGRSIVLRTYLSFPSNQNIHIEKQKHTDKQYELLKKAIYPTAKIRAKKNDHVVAIPPNK